MFRKSRGVVRWTRRIVRAVILLALIAIGVGAVIGLQSLPRNEGVVALKRDAGAPSVSADVSIRRDRMGVPHIKAQSRQDAYFALGFAHAQDRLWQLEMHRRIASGTLAEILGEPGLVTDRFIRSLGVRRAAEQQYARLPQEARASLEAYAAGVNAFVEQEMIAPPMEFWFTRSQPGRWAPVDSVAWLMMMALDLGGNYNHELIRLALARTLSREDIWRVLPPYADDPVPSSADWPTLYRDLGVYNKNAKQAALPGPISPFISAGIDGLGSNNWVLSGARTQTGKPLLANDPHLGLTAPAIWYFARLEAPGLDVIGATLPGVPAVVLGRNRKIAWGFTNTGPDVQDLYLEQIDPGDPKRYRTPDGSAAFAEHDEIIKVKGKPDVVMKVRATRHGPVMTDVLPGVADYLETNRYQIAMRWTALDPENLAIVATDALAQAGTVAEARDALRDYVAPMQSVVIADSDGGIGFVAAGRLPVRKPDNDLKGLAPALGWEAKYDWGGDVPFDELPQALNPPDGVIATANQRIHSPDYPHHVTYDWTSPDRYNRIIALLAAREKHTAESFRAIMGDVKSLAAERLLKHFRSAEAASQHRLADRARAAASSFDGTMTAESAGPAIFSSFADQLTQSVFFDELPRTVIAGYAASGRDFRHGLDKVLAANDERWCDDVRTPVRETCDDMVRATYDRGLDELVRLYGEDVANWTWGRVHAARSQHRPLGAVPTLARFLDVVSPTGGDSYTINAGRLNLGDRNAPFANRHAASLRAIYDLSDLDRSRFIFQTGQSGNVLSRHYRDMADRWAKVEDLPLTMRPDGPMRELTLEPAR
ncbi:MAG: penicillin acylase family protein [Beijerinckiaceae bacterium]